MKFFSGFGFKNEQDLFEDYLPKSKYIVAGFSYGAAKALEYALSTTTRVDRLILLSPSFFNDKPQSFKRAQVHYHNLDKHAYIKNFLDNVCYPNKMDINNKYLFETNQDELHNLLHFNWIEEDIKNILDKNIKIEVFLGGMDKIIDSKAANDFFSKLTTTYFIKKAGHILNVK